MMCPIHGPSHGVAKCYYCEDEKMAMMGNKVFQYHGELHCDILDEVRSKMEPEEKLEMEIKTIEVARTKKFSSYEFRLLFEDAFKLGYVASKAKKAK